MTDVSDIEDLLAKARKHAARLAWVKTALVCMSALLGSAAGASRAALGLAAIVRQIATKDDVAALMAGQQEQIKGLQDTQRVHGDRIAAIEPLARGAASGVAFLTTRVDHLYQLPMQVRNR